MKEEISKQNQGLISGFMDDLDVDQKRKLLQSQQSEKKNSERNKARNKRKQASKTVFRFDHSRRPHGPAKRYKIVRNKVDFQRYVLLGNRVIDTKPNVDGVISNCVRKYSDPAAAIRFCNRANAIHSERFIKY